MKTVLLTSPQAVIEADLLDEFVSGRRDWQIRELPSGSLAEQAGTPEVTVVQLNNETRPAQVKSMIPELARIQRKYPQGSYVVFALRQHARLAVQRAREQKRRMQTLVEEIRQGLPEFSNAERVDVSFVRDGGELAARLGLIEAKLKAAPPRPSPLDRVREVVEATQDLRGNNGKLSADAVAAAFGVSLNQLAHWLGRTRQALSKTPDADSLQDDLAFFERTARLRTLVAKEDFLKWLRVPNPQLDNKPPLELLAKGERQVVADLVDDMLTGEPA